MSKYVFFSIGLLRSGVFDVFLVCATSRAEFLMATQVAILAGVLVGAQVEASVPVCSIHRGHKP